MMGKGQKKANIDVSSDFDPDPLLVFFTALSLIKSNLVIEISFNINVYSRIRKLIKNSKIMLEMIV